MKLYCLLLGAAFGLGSARQPTKDSPFGRGCLVPLAESSDDAARAATEAPSAASMRRSLPETIDVDVHFHIASTVNDTDLINQDILDAQWKVLHETYLAYNINLSLNSSDRIVSDRAGQYFIVDESTGEFPNYVNYEDEKNEYLSSTRKGGYDVLNIYFFSRYLPGATGYCTFPTVLDANDSTTLGLDGCAVKGLTMPGITVDQGGFPEYNQGHVAVHEAGHWYVSTSSGHGHDELSGRVSSRRS